VPRQVSNISPYWREMVDDDTAGLVLSLEDIQILFVTARNEQLCLMPLPMHRLPVLFLLLSLWHPI
jgi:hypothetical protein